MALTTRIINSIEQLEQLEPEWCHLLAASESSTFFSTPTFQLSWLSTIGADRTPHYFACYDSEQLVGLLPLIESTDAPSRLESVGSVDVTDYSDAIVKPEHVSNFFIALSQHIVAERLTLRLYGLPETATLRSHRFADTLTMSESEQTVAPQMTLPADWEAYLQQLDRKQRHEVKRKWRKVEALSHQFEVLTSEEQVAAALADFFKLHASSSAEKAAFWNEQTTAFFTQLLTRTATAEQLKLFFLEIQGERVATMLVFDFHSTYYLYNSGFNPNAYHNLSTGTVLTAYTIQHAIENATSNYDFLRGTETYKFRLGGKAHPIFDKIIQPK